jgi:uncharacterized protein
MFGKKKERQFEEIFQEHVETSAKCAEELFQLFNNFSFAAQHIQKIIELEHNADKLVGETYRRLDNTFISRYDKPDIEHLITNLDNIIDFMKKVAIDIQIYRIPVARKEAPTFANIIVEMLKYLQEAIKQLPNLNMEKMQNYVIHIKELEEKADALVNQAIQNLFDEENDFKTLIKWKDIFEKLETITDHAEHVINTLSTIIRKESL